MKLMPKKWIVFLWVYITILFVITEILRVNYSGGNTIFKEKLILALTGFFLIEFLNQITFQLSKKDYHKAVVVKGVFFWAIFSSLFFMYWFFLLKTERVFIWKWSEFPGVMILYLIFIYALPLYSLCPKIRFLFLLDKFSWHK